MTLIIVIIVLAKKMVTVWTNYRSSLAWLCLKWAFNDERHENFFPQNWHTYLGSWCFPLMCSRSLYFWGNDTWQTSQTNVFGLMLLHICKCLLIDPWEVNSALPNVHLSNETFKCEAQWYLYWTDWLNPLLQIWQVCLNSKECLFFICNDKPNLLLNIFPHWAQRLFFCTPRSWSDLLLDPEAESFLVIGWLATAFDPDTCSLVLCLFMCLL